ncbi:unnamed protein product [Adineta steineri]|uniref:Uncharacterized protein n=1 Tax=Adineta steineri TaxID=433720 RepID=A0A813X071_9BILA|nr:unnamed protein product [Adineta steineri]
MTESTAMASNDDDEPLLNTIVDNSTTSNRRCPTCQGTGSVSTSPGLVALIPVDDVRLKRRHTFLWIVLTIFFCTLIALAVIATILPRSVHLSIKNPIVIDATDDSVRNSTDYRLTFIHQSNIQSDNWVPIRLINLTTLVEHQLVPIGPNAQKIYSHQMYLRPLGTIQSNLTVQLDFNENSMAYRACQGIFRQMLLFKVQTILTYADFLLGRIQTTNNVSYQYVLCNRGEWKPHETILVNMTTTDNHDDDVKQYDSVQEASWTYTMKYFYFKFQQRIEDEKIVEHNVKLTLPNYNNYTRQQFTEIPYRYSTWRSSPNLARRLTSFDHYIYTELLIILDHFFRRHQITYLITDGTLLGSYTHHDFLPWDDDVDLRVSNRDRQRMLNLVSQELRNIISVADVTEEYGTYHKFYFPWSPQAGKQNWSYPCVDVFYFDENSTHIWRINSDEKSMNDCPVSKHNIFPLVWRLFGRIWLPAPREPLIIFEIHRWTAIGEWYYAKNYSHKYERTLSIMNDRARPHELYPYYPWVQRSCSQTHCIEQLITMDDNTNITIHTVQFEKYRTKLIINPKFEIKNCWL